MGAVDYITDLLQRIEKTVVAVAPKAWEVLQTIKRIEGVQWLLTGFVSLVVGLWLMRTASRAIVAWVEWREEKAGPYDDAPAYLWVPAVLGTVGSVIAFGVAAGVLLNVWNWIAVFHPGLALAHDAYRFAVEKLSRH